MCQLPIRLDNPVHREVAGAGLPQGRDHPEAGRQRHEGHRHRRRVQDRINRRGNLLDEIIFVHRLCWLLDTLSEKMSIVYEYYVVESFSSSILYPHFISS